MDDLETQENTRSIRLKQIMERINRHCNPEDSNGVELHKSIESLPEIEKKKARAANVVYDGLMMTLNNIADYSLQKAKQEQDPLASDYETVLVAMEPLTQICRSLADGRLVLQENTHFEQKRAQVNDQVHAYRRENFSLDGIYYDQVRVIIRPRRWEQAATVRETADRPQLDHLVESAQARMAIYIRPKNFPHGEIVMRVDREDLEHNFEITYDVEIRNQFGEQGLMDRLTFPEDVTGFGEGHHFSSSIKEEDLGVKFTDILVSINQKFAPSKT